MKCAQCQSSFEILEPDKKFYKKMEVPTPTLCYLCRMQRRLSYRSERFLYHRKCDLTGKQIISTYSDDKPFIVYNNDDWWSDKWDPLDYGCDFDFNRPFFEQFFELREKVPRLALIQQKPMENSAYCNAASHNKNCYLVFSTNRCEDCYYGSWVNQCKNCIDGLNINHCELCYECVGCNDCYACQYCQDSSNCKNSYFLRGCQGCIDCFACTNLMNKKYCIFNEQKTEQEYRQFMAEINLGNYSVIQKIKEKYDEVVNDLVVRHFTGISNENVVGDYLRNCKNAYVCFECDSCEETRYCLCLESSKNCMDHSHWGVGAEWVYETQACGYEPYFIRFCNLCWTSCSDLTYCDHTHRSRNCFGCVGLKDQQYCVLNKKYSKSDYEALTSKIINHMKSTGEWGQFFPVKDSIYAYNETLAYEQFPLTKQEVLKKGWQWKDMEDQKNYKGPDYVIPNDIAEVDEEIIKQILICEKTGKPYKIIPQELAFYRQQNIPIPRLHPDERHWNRLGKRNKRLLYERQCRKCHQPIRTTYSPDRPEKVYCEPCYLREIYQ